MPGHFVRHVKNESELLAILNVAKAQGDQLVSIIPKPDGKFTVIFLGDPETRKTPLSQCTGNSIVLPFAGVHVPGHLHITAKKAHLRNDFPAGDCTMQAGGALMIDVGGEALFASSVMTGARVSERPPGIGGPDIWHQTFQFYLSDGSAPLDLLFSFDGPDMDHGDAAWHPFNQGFGFDASYFDSIASVWWFGCC